MDYWILVANRYINLARVGTIEFDGVNEASIKSGKLYPDVLVTGQPGGRAIELSQPEARALFRYLQPRVLDPHTPASG